MGALLKDFRDGHGELLKDRLFLGGAGLDDDFKAAVRVDLNLTGLGNECATDRGLRGAGRQQG